MAIGYPVPDQSSQFNSTYNITMDMSGWSKTMIQVVSPMSGAIVVYGTNDANALQGVRDGNASLATNFNPVQVTNLATGTAVNSISAAGNYKYDVDARFLRLQGSPSGTGTSVYRILMFNSKID